MGTRARTVPQNCWVSVPWAAARCLAPRAPCVTILTQIGNHLIAQATPQQEGCLCRIVWRKRVSFSVPDVTGPWTHKSAHSLRIVSWTFDMFVRRAAWKRSAPLLTKAEAGLTRIVIAEDRKNLLPKDHPCVDHRLQVKSGVCVRSWRRGPCLSIVT
jgi:hypothetical protein